MQIAGIQRTTLVDYPGKVSATIFTRGCSFRCPFCHNPELVLPEKFNPIIPEEEILSFLATRKGKLQAVCITGGEPTIHNDIHSFIHKIKEMGFLVKLDSNGWNPEVLEEAIRSGEVDYIAMDIKSPLDKYPMATGISSQFSVLSKNDPKGSVISACLPDRQAHPERPLRHSRSSNCHSREGGNLMSNIRRSIKLIMESGLDYEFRTTVCHPIHEVEDFEEIGKLIKGAKKYYIQNFVESKQISELQKFTSFSDEELKAAAKIILNYSNEVQVR